MPYPVTDQDAVVIGGGFYGASIAIYLVKHRGLARVTLIEREAALGTRASYHNQARVHNGYHYPRSFTTTYRSRINLPRFVRDWSDAVTQDFTKLYAIARRNSKVTARQFVRFCQEIGASLRPVDPRIRALFDPRLVEDVFLAEEYVFDAVKLIRSAEKELDNLGITMRMREQATGLEKASTGALRTFTQDVNGIRTSLTSRYIFNCTYSGINQLKGDFPGVHVGLKHEITEMALLDVPPVLQGLGVTLMDGPFFSLMPFPARQLHTLSHVRYTPHQYWNDLRGNDPDRKLREYDRHSRAHYMIRDAMRYMPGLGAARYVDSLFEIKTVLMKNETDDGRPILFEKYHDFPGVYSVLGGKIDNIYDIFELLDNEPNLK